MIFNLCTLDQHSFHSIGTMPVESSKKCENVEFEQVKMLLHISGVTFFLQLPARDLQYCASADCNYQEAKTGRF